MTTQSDPDQLASFGPNEWLVDEIYQQYLADPKSVDPAWWDFFADYMPTEHAGIELTTAALAAHEAARNEAEIKEAAADAETSSHDAAQSVAAPAVVTPPIPPAPAATPAPVPAAQPAAEVVVLKGPAARVVTNMEASLALPTAIRKRACQLTSQIHTQIVSLKKSSITS